MTFYQLLIVTLGTAAIYELYLIGSSLDEYVKAFKLAAMGQRSGVSKEALGSLSDELGE